MISLQTKLLYQNPSVVFTSSTPINISNSLRETVKATVNSLGTIVGGISLLTIVSWEQWMWYSCPGSTLQTQFESLNQVCTYRSKWIGVLSPNYNLVPSISGNQWFVNKSLDSQSAVRGSNQYNPTWFHSPNDHWHQYLWAAPGAVLSSWRSY